VLLIGVPVAKGDAVTGMAFAQIPGIREREHWLDEVETK
jgi:hypothetical protein